MTYRFCHRCQAELLPHDEGTLIFCAHCGAPQVTLSEDLQTQFAEQTTEQSEVSADAPAVKRSRVWKNALHCVALAAAVTTVLTLASVALPKAILLAYLWTVISPVVVLGLFQARSPLTAITTGFGARLGLVTGLAVSFALMAVHAVMLLTLRHMHALAEFDTQMDAAVRNVQTQLQAQPDSPASALALAHSMMLPEFRAGMLLGGAALMTVLLVVLTTVGGAFAGFVRSRRTES